MKTCKQRTLKEIQAHNNMTSGQRLKHQYSWSIFDWLQDEHPFIAVMLSVILVIGFTAMIAWAFLHPYG